MRSLRRKAAEDTAAPGSKPKLDRDFHAKGHGAGRATLFVSADIPDEYRYGLFAEPCAHKADYRVSNGLLGWAKRAPDVLNDVHGFAIKAERFSNGLLWTGEVACSQDIQGTDVRPFARTPGQFVGFGVATGKLFSTLFRCAKAGAHIAPSLGGFGTALGGIGGAILGLVAGTTKMLKSYLTNPDIAQDLGHRVLETARMLGTVAAKTAIPRRSLAASEYEVAVVQVGPTAARLVIAPSEETKATLKKSWKFWRRDYLRENWDDNRAQGPMTFELFLLPYKNEKDTPLDRPNQAWKTERVKVAELVIPKLGSSELEAAEEARIENNLIQPWHTFQERSRESLPPEAVEERQRQGHTPLSAFQRSRGPVYTESGSDRGANPEPVRSKKG
jgi:hypothetical protein